MAQEYNVGSGRPLLRSLRSENRRCCKASDVMLLWFIYYISAGLAPSLVYSVPPHLRACPGPLTKDARECKASGTATLSAVPFRSRNGIMSSNCDIVDGILQCIVQLSAGSVIIPVHRHGGFAGEGSVSYATFPGSAKSNLQFHASSGVISWAPLRVSRYPCLVPCASLPCLFLPLLSVPRRCHCRLHAALIFQLKWYAGRASGDRNSAHRHRHL